MKQQYIPTIHIILFFMTFVGLKNHVVILPPLLTHVGRNGWASVLLTILAIVPIVLLLLYIHKQTDQKLIIQVLQEQIGPVWTKLFIFLLTIFLILLAVFTMRETMQWISSSFLLRTPEVLLIVIYTALCFVLATTNVQTIAITNFYILFGIVLFGFFVAIVNFQVKDFKLLLPLFENGFQPVLNGMVYPASGMIEIVLLLFLQHHVKERLRFSHYAIIIAILAVLTLGPLLGAITEFGPDEATKQDFPAYEEWGLVMIGRFIEHLDFLSIYQWLTGAFIRVGIIFFIIIQLFGLGDKPKKAWMYVTPPFLAITFFFMTLEYATFKKIREMYFLPITVVFLLLVLLFIGVVAYFYRKSQGEGRT